MLDGLWPLLMFSLSSSVTPGPNNIMVTNSAATFGIRRTLPHMFGILAGFTVMVVLIGLGLGSAFHQYPLIHKTLKVVGVCYILFLAYKIAFSGKSTEKTAQGTPLTILQAMLFQWVNPKAWMMAITGITTFTSVQGVHIFQEIMVIAAAFMLGCLVSLPLWGLCGIAISVLLASEKRLRIFNMVMAGLLVLSILPMVS